MIRARSKGRTTISAIITRADGTTVDLGIIARTPSRWARLFRKA